jgi:hypothetical protein
VLEAHSNRSPYEQLHLSPRYGVDRVIKVILGVLRRLRLKPTVIGDTHQMLSITRLLICLELNSNPRQIFLLAMRCAVLKVSNVDALTHLV